MSRTSSPTSHRLLWPQGPRFSVVIASHHRLVPTHMRPSGPSSTQRHIDARQRVAIEFLSNLITVEDCHTTEAAHPEAAVIGVGYIANVGAQQMLSIPVAAFRRLAGMAIESMWVASHRPRLLSVIAARIALVRRNLCFLWPCHPVRTNFRADHSKAASPSKHTAWQSTRRSLQTARMSYRSPGTARSSRLSKRFPEVSVSMSNAGPNSAAVVHSRSPLLSR